MYRLIVGMMLLFVVSGIVPAEQLTTVGIIDIRKVHTTFYNTSSKARIFEALRQRYQREIDAQLETLESLKSRRQSAVATRDNARAQQLDNQIEQINNRIVQIRQRSQQDLANRQQTLIDDEFLTQLQRAIVFVSESNGFTVVLRTDDEGLQWWSQAVDITDLVVERLLESSE